MSAPTNGSVARRHRREDRWQAAITPRSSVITLADVRAARNGTGQQISVEASGLAAVGVPQHPGDERQTMAQISWRSSAASSRL